MKSCSSRILPVFLFLIVATPSSGRAQVVLSEVMYDAAGSESHDEFVEIVNRSAVDTVDLTGWQISDGVGSDRLIAHESGLRLAPGQFCLILDPSYFDHSNSYDALIPTSSLVITIDNATFGSGGLSNSTAETVSLSDSTGRLVAEYTYSLGNLPGHSDEKVDLDGPDAASNWADSRGVLGTPGAPNSVSPLSKDLEVRAGDIAFSPPRVSASEAVEIVATVRNAGSEAAPAFSVSFFEDLNFDAMPDPGELLGEPVNVEITLEAGDSISVSWRLPAIAAGRHLFIVWAQLAGDQDPGNDRAVATLSVPYAKGAVQINEIMVAPRTGEAEWVELANLTQQAIPLRGWSLADSGTRSREVGGAAVVAPAGGLFVMAEDSSVLRLGAPAGSVVVLPGWPGLNNDGDAVVLLDPTGAPVDSLFYRSAWGSGGAGTSLEKINPSLPGTDSTNWSSSVAAAGATPGTRNSIFAEKLVKAATVSVSPNPFSPDGDGQDDFALISYSLPVTTAQVNVKIYDLRGRLIRFIANNRASGAENTLVWDGKDDRGQLARLGIYVVFLQALNAGQGVVATQKTTVVLAQRL